LRRSEQLDQLGEPLLKQMISKADQYLNSLQHAPLVLETLRSPLLSTQLRTTCFEEICKKITKPEESGEVTESETESEVNPLATLVGHRFLKKIIQFKDIQAEEDPNVVLKERPDYQTHFFQTVSSFIKEAALHRYASFVISALLSIESLKKKSFGGVKRNQGTTCKISSRRISTHRNTTLIKFSRVSFVSFELN